MYVPVNMCFQYIHLVFYFRFGVLSQNGFTHSESETVNVCMYVCVYVCILGYICMSNHAYTDSFVYSESEIVYVYMFVCLNMCVCLLDIHKWLCIQRKRDCVCIYVCMFGNVCVSNKVYIDGFAYSEAYSESESMYTCACVHV
jgi:hypothetical protein